MVIIIVSMPAKDVSILKAFNEITAGTHNLYSMHSGRE